MLLAFISFIIAPGANAGVIFQEGFEDQPDWTSDDFALDGTLPLNWYTHRNDELWSPRTGHQDRKPVAEISGKNSDKAHTGSKSFVAWRESYDPGWKKFNSDSILVKYFPEGHDELYVEFWVNFSEEMINTYHMGALGASKMFRVYHFNGIYEDRFNFFGDINSPKYIWDVSGGPTYGIRNAMSFYARGPNHLNGEIEDLPHQLNGGGDMSASYKTELAGMRMDGTDAHLPNKVDGGLITHQPGTAALDHVFGDEQTWTKVAFYVRMNSAPGVQNGVAMQWIDDQRIFYNENIDWVREGYDMVKWNTIAISGNDFFRGYDNERRYEEWYAIDDIVVMDAIPHELVCGHTTASTSRNFSVAY